MLYMLYCQWYCWFLRTSDVFYNVNNSWSSLICHSWWYSDGGTHQVCKSCHLCTKLLLDSAGRKQKGQTFGNEIPSWTSPSAGYLHIWEQEFQSSTLWSVCCVGLKKVASFKWFLPTTWIKHITFCPLQSRNILLWVNLSWLWNLAAFDRRFSAFLIWASSLQKKL